MIVDKIAELPESERDDLVGMLMSDARARLHPAVRPQVEILTTEDPTNVLSMAPLGAALTFPTFVKSKHSGETFAMRKPTWAGAAWDIANPVTMARAAKFVALVDQLPRCCALELEVSGSPVYFDSTIDELFKSSASAAELRPLAQALFAEFREVNPDPSQWFPKGHFIDCMRKRGARADKSALERIYNRMQLEEGKTKQGRPPTYKSLLKADLKVQR